VKESPTHSVPSTVLWERFKCKIRREAVVNRPSSAGGRILHVDLTSGRTWTEPTEPYCSKFIGGRGVDAWLLYKEVKPWMTPFDPANRLIFGAGALTGTMAPCATRYSVEAKSPVTGATGSGNSCGFFGQELRLSGYDHIVIRGKARTPVYLRITNEKAELRNSSHLWGKTTWETDRCIKEETGDPRTQVACIGPSGENLVKAACVITNRARAVGKCGLGAVMGAKNLKAVAVRGTGSVQVAYPGRFMEEVDRVLGKLKRSERAESLRSWGTYGRPVPLNESCLFPVRNFQDDHWDPDKVNGLLPEVYREVYEVGRRGYLSCPLYCSHLYKIDEGPYSGLACEGFEFNTVWNFMSRLDIDYVPAVIKLHSLCNEYGLDQDGASCVIAWAFECFEKGILTEKDTGGLKLKWGDHEAVAELLRKMAWREGIGDLLAEGSQRASALIGRGAERYATHLKGQDSMEAMRAAKGWALGCCVSTRGGGHTRGANLVELAHKTISPEVAHKTWGIPEVTAPSSCEGKATLVAYYERLQAIVDSLGLCLFTSTWWSPDLLDPEDYARLYSAATGREVDGRELMLAGERIHNVEKAFNVLHAGFCRQDDDPPGRFMEEPVKSGPARGECLRREDWDPMLDEYYELHGWEKKTGWQTRSQLKRIGLEEVADDLERAGRLASLTY
jgi:aldehyde:ferredoxin oxidoreductase